MRNTQIHLDRLAAALARHHVTLPRHALLEATAASHGFRNSKDLSAAMRGADATPPAARLVCTTMRLGRTMAEIVDPIADLPYSMVVTSELPAYGVSPYGNLLDLSCLRQANVGDAIQGGFKDEIARRTGTRQAAAAIPSSEPARSVRTMTVAELSAAMAVTTHDQTGGIAHAGDGYQEPTPPNARWETTGPRISSPERQAAMRRLAELLAEPNATRDDALLLRQAIDLGGRLDTVGWCASTPCDVADEQVLISNMAKRTERLCYVTDVVRALGTPFATLHGPDLDEVRALVDRTTSMRLMLLAAADGIMREGLATLLPERREEIEAFARADQALILGHVEQDERQSDQRAMAASRMTRLRITAEAAINMPKTHVGPTWALPGDWLFERVLGRKYRQRSAREMLEVEVSRRDASFDYVVMTEAGRPTKPALRTERISDAHPSRRMSATNGQPGNPMEYLLDGDDRPTLLDVARRAYVAHSLGMGGPQWIGWAIDDDIDDSDQCTCQIEFGQQAAWG